jgi:hypothetical protein
VTLYATTVARTPVAREVSPHVVVDNVAESLQNRAWRLVGSCTTPYPRTGRNVPISKVALRRSLCSLTSPTTCPRTMWLFASLVVTTLFTTVYSCGTSCSVPLGAGSASPCDPYWLESITQRGTSAFNPNPDYTVRVSTSSTPATCNLTSAPRYFEM